jgi:hypothetical protein
MPSNPLPGVPLAESPLFESLVSALPAEVAAVARQLHDTGFAVIDFPDPEFPAVASELIRQLSPRYDFDAWRSGAADLRLQDADHPLVRRIACNERVIALLSRIYGRAAFPFQTLNFPVGTQQHFHTDSVHFSCIPERFMCGVWVALEDVGPDQGPLVYYPGSHRLPIYGNEHYEGDDPSSGRHQGNYHRAWQGMVDALGLKPETFCPRRGQALIWAANLLHGGAPHHDRSRTRWSQVTHYYFENCVYYVPMQSHPAFGRLTLKKVRDLRTGAAVEHRYLGSALPPEVQDFHRNQRPGPVRKLLRRWFPPPEQRLPEDFDARTYFRLHPDVKASGVDAATHYIRHGRTEGRSYKP